MATGDATGSVCQAGAVRVAISPAVEFGIKPRARLFHAVFPNARFDLDRSSPAHDVTEYAGAVAVDAMFGAAE